MRLGLMLLALLVIGCDFAPKKPANQQFTCPEGMVLHADRHPIQQPTHWYCIPGSEVTPIAEGSK